MIVVIVVAPWLRDVEDALTQKSEMGPPVSNWEDLEAYDDYEILLHGG